MNAMQSLIGLSTNIHSVRFTIKFRVKPISARRPIIQISLWLYYNIEASDGWSIYKSLLCKIELGLY